LEHAADQLCPTVMYAVLPGLSFVPQDAFGQEMRVLITWPCSTTSLLTPVLCVTTFHFALWVCQVRWC